MFWWIVLINSCFSDCLWNTPALRGSWILVNAAGDRLTYWTVTVSMNSRKQRLLTICWQQGFVSGSSQARRVQFTIIVTREWQNMAKTSQHIDAVASEVSMHFFKRHWPWHCIAGVARPLFSWHELNRCFYCMDFENSFEQYKKHYSDQVQWRLWVSMNLICLAKI